MATTTTFVTGWIGDSQIKGVEYIDAQVKRFLAIPYALPPTGQHRFCRPRPLPAGFKYEAKDGGPLDCTAFGAVCPQPIYLLNDTTPIAAPPSTSTFSEDCLTLNIWLPSRPAPDAGWPVMAWIHGGWFQVGSPLHDPSSDPVELLSPSGAGLSCIIVAIGYRLNVFGFLSSSQTKGNFGLWDQRAGLEWIHHNIHHFKGDPANVTLAGLSAGANSVHQQLHYEFFESKMESIFHRAIMYSNSISAQSRTPEEATEQFHELCSAFNISSTLSYEQKLQELRRIKDTELAAKLLSLRTHTFRPVTDDEFVSSELVKRAQSGQFAAKFQRRKFKLILGEVENESRTYRGVYPPSSHSDVLMHLQHYYSPETSHSLFRLQDHISGRDEKDKETWKDLFGELVAAAQVHASERLFISQLLHRSTGLTTSDVLRYRISKRLSFFSRTGVPLDLGVAHGFCQPIYWFQRRAGFTADEEAAVKAWLLPWKAFIENRQVLWGTSDMKQYRSFNADGSIEIEDDIWWDHFEPYHEVLMPSITAHKL